MSLISLRGEGGDKKQKNKGCGVSWGIEGRRREVGEGGRELEVGGGWGGVLLSGEIRSQLTPHPHTPSQRLLW